MITHATLEALFIHTLSKISGIPVTRWRVGTRAGTRPTEGLFGVITWKRTEPLKQLEDPEFTQDGDNDPTFTDLNACYCTLEIKVLGENSRNVLSEIMFGLQSINRTWDIWNVVGFGGVTEIQNASTPLGGRIQEWSVMDVSFYVNFERTYLAEYFTKVPVTINDRPAIWPVEKEVCE